MTGTFHLLLVVASIGELRSLILGSCYQDIFSIAIALRDPPSTYLYHSSTFVKPNNFEDDSHGDAIRSVLIPQIGELLSNKALAAALNSMFAIPLPHSDKTQQIDVMDFHSTDKIFDNVQNL
jgi:hypothetical protein